MLKTDTLSAMCSQRMTCAFVSCNPDDRQTLFLKSCLVRLAGIHCRVSDGGMP